MTDTLNPATTVDFIEHMRKMRVSDQTLRSYRTALHLFMDYTEQPVTRDELEDSALDWLDTINPASQGPRLAALRKFARWQHKTVLLDGFKIEARKKQKHTPLPDLMDSVHLMAEASPKRSTKLVIMLCGTMGMRVSEARKLTAAQVNLIENTIEIYGKGAKWRTVPIPARTLPFITEALDYIAVPAQQLCNDSDATVRRNITAAARDAGISRRVSSHDLRSTFARYIWNRTNDQVLLMSLMGHSEWSTTLGYLGQDDNKARSAVQ